MFDSLTFTSPLLWWGALATVIPLAIHWLLRPRPQRVLFPATFLLRRALSEGQKAQRLRNLWLLLVRALGLLLVVALLAGPTCRQDVHAARDDRPIAAVLVCDDSWSAAYRTGDDETLLDQVRAAALRVVAEARGWPPGSQVGFVTAGTELDAVPPTAQIEQVEDQLQRMRDVRPHARTIRSAVGRAGEWLRLAGPARRRLYIVGDLAGHAFRDATADLLAGIDRLEVFAIAPPAIRRTNLSIAAISGPPGVLAETAPVPLDLSFRAEGTGARVTIVVRSGDRVLLRSEPEELEPDATVDLHVDLPRLARGVHGLTVTLEPTDRLPHDQARFLGVEVGPPPEVWLLDPRVDRGRSLTAHLLENLLAPPLLPEEQRLVTLRRLTIDRIPETGVPPRLILLPSGINLPDAARNHIRDLVERGAQLVLVPAAGARTDWPGLLRRHFAARVEQVRLPSPARIASDPDGRLPEQVHAALGRAVVDVRLELFDPADGLQTVARYDDGRPAIVRRAFGRGAITLLTTSPDPAWSTLGARALGLLSWLLDLADAGGAGTSGVALLPVHALPPADTANLPRQGTATLITPDGTQRPIQFEAGVEWPTDAPGLVSVRLADGTLRMLALNWPAAESDLTPIDVAAVATRLGVEQVRLLGDPDRADQSDWARLLARPGQWLAAALLLALTLELLLSERRAHPRPQREPSSG